MRSRACIPPQYGGHSCTEPMFEKKNCIQVPCLSKWTATFLSRYLNISVLPFFLICAFCLYMYTYCFTFFSNFYLAPPVGEYRVYKLPKKKTWHYMSSKIMPLIKWTYWKINKLRYVVRRNVGSDFERSRISKLHKYYSLLLVATLMRFCKIQTLSFESRKKVRNK